MNKKVIAVLLVLVLGGGIGYYFYSKKEQGSAEDQKKVDAQTEQFEDEIDLDNLPTEMPSFEDDIEETAPVSDTIPVEIDTLEMAV